LCIDKFDAHDPWSSHPGGRTTQPFTETSPKSAKADGSCALEAPRLPTTRMLPSERKANGFCGSAREIEESGPKDERKWPMGNSEPSFAFPLLQP